MIILNLLKKYHGLRAKYYADRKKMGKQYSFPIFYIVLAATLIIGPYYGYSYINENIVPFFAKLMAPEETTKSFNEANKMGGVSGSFVNNPKHCQVSKSYTTPKNIPKKSREFLYIVDFGLNGFAEALNQEIIRHNNLILSNLPSNVVS